MVEVCVTVVPALMAQGVKFSAHMAVMGGGSVTRRRCLVSVMRAFMDYRVNTHFVLETVLFMVLVETTDVHAIKVTKA